MHKLAAYAYARRGPQAPEFADFLQWARLGLMEAFDRYDPAREAAFMTFAGYRIRGAILNGLEHVTEGAAQWAQQGSKKSASNRWWRAATTPRRSSASPT